MLMTITVPQSLGGTASHTKWRPGVGKSFYSFILMFLGFLGIKGNCRKGNLLERPQNCPQKKMLLSCWSKFFQVSRQGTSPTRGCMKTPCKPLSVVLYKTHYSCSDVVLRLPPVKSIYRVLHWNKSDKFYSPQATRKNMYNRLHRIYEIYVTEEPQSLRKEDVSYHKISVRRMSRSVSRRKQIKKIYMYIYSEKELQGHCRCSSGSVNVTGSLGPLFYPLLMAFI